MKLLGSHRRVVRLFALFIGIFLIASAASAQTEQLVYVFAGAGTADGSGPNGGLVADSKGNLYGTTTLGGAAYAGMVFELSPPVPPSGRWTETILYSFTGAGGDGDGAYPFGNLVFDTAGNLYGTTFYGGASNPCISGTVGCGTVFKLAPPSVAGGAWTESVIYAFQGGNDGNGPAAGVAFDQSGNLYGTTFGDGGILSDGTVYQLTPQSNSSWTETVLYRFSGSDGSQPESTPVFDPAGNLYATTSAGGSSGQGTVFELSPAGGKLWAETVLHSFLGLDGSSPSFASLVMDATGRLAGTTYGGGRSGGGVVFAMQPPSSSGGAWSYHRIYSFGGQQSDGTGPEAGLTLGAKDVLYGTTTIGGVGGCGTVFQLKPPSGNTGWTETVLHSFSGNYHGFDGCTPDAPLLLHDGALYGTTSAGGDSAGDGTVFKIHR
ncbi:MAG TPA: choice-of-anchor tandem repeat GloVer-containing protein [Terriglobales bacterium]|nr:choice-of-anchor tandem repeat GloVer-containing protein [Terriglobales bacterium]